MENLKRADIDALVAKKWPSALNSPLASIVRNITDDVRNEAALHAQSCLDACDGWDIETLGHNIESNFPELDPETCDEIAAAAITQKDLR